MALYNAIILYNATGTNVTCMTHRSLLPLVLSANVGLWEARNA
jgi:hypothetical protein